jgi:hypothetical protein
MESVRQQQLAFTGVKSRDLCDAMWAEGQAKPRSQGPGLCGAEWGLYLAASTSQCSE